MHFWRKCMHFCAKVAPLDPFSPRSQIGLGRRHVATEGLAVAAVSPHFSCCASPCSCSRGALSVSERVSESVEGCCGTSLAFSLFRSCAWPSTRVSEGVEGSSCV